MKAYIINLKRARLRRESVLLEVEREGVEHVLIEAIDGGEVDPDEIYKFADMEIVKKVPNWLTVRMLAASLSHRKAMGQFIQDGGPCALFLEDDVRLYANFKETAEAVGSSLEDGEAALLHFVSTSKSPIKLSAKNRIEVSNQRSVYWPISYEGLGSGACYILTRLAAQRMYDGLIPLTTAPDSWRDFVAKGLIDGIRLVYPMAAGISCEKSTINVDTQSSLRRRVTEFIDQKKIPVLTAAYIMFKKQIVKRRSQVEIVDEPSPLSGTQSI